MIDTLRKNVMLFMAFFLILAGCDQVYNNFHDNLKKIDSSIQDSNWKDAAKGLKQMKKDYKNKYHWQDYYTEPQEVVMLMETIGELDGAIQVKDKKQAKIAIAKLKAMLKSLYYQD